MSLKQQKIDVTDRVVGKLKNGEIELFLENERIGKMTIPTGCQIELDHHFEGNQEKIYQHVTAPTDPEPRYTDCDEGGWC
ncbi:YusG family protein [Cytobacillus sp. FJAT-54145]|uniref:YusG family protein n=1 Tax=Cytobacillus spartinae TaxID=3299023 RepID=A0ABW6KDH6_9BACI